MVTRKLGPALAAGCTVVIKTAGETPFTANALAFLAQEAGIPNGVINIVTALDNTPQIGEVFCSSPLIRKISFTGSTRVGRLLMKQSSDTVKKLSLELGGNAPFIVFDDADLDIAVAGAIASKFKVSGQTCVCANRIYVQRGIHDEFIKRFAAVVNSFKLGNGADGTVTHGPLINEKAAARMEELVKDAAKNGAKLVFGGRRVPSLGKSSCIYILFTLCSVPASILLTSICSSLHIGPAFFEPTILTNAAQGMRVVEEEIFGPIAAIQVFDTEEEAVDAANNCDVGLASYLFTQDISRLSRVAETLHSGMVAANTGVISDASSP